MLVGMEGWWLHRYIWGRSNSWEHSAPKDMLAQGSEADTIVAFEPHINVDVGVVAPAVRFKTACEGSKIYMIITTDMQPVWNF